MGRNGGGGAHGPQYDEIPYGDVPPAQPQSQMQNGHSGKGELPNVPAEYSQLPNLPQRQGIKSIKIMMILMATVAEVAVISVGLPNDERAAKLAIAQSIALHNLTNLFFSFVSSVVRCSI